MSFISTYFYFYFIYGLSISFKFPKLNRIKRNEDHNKHPNIILITTSQIGWEDVTFHNSLNKFTPNLLTFSRNSIIFNSHYISPFEYFSKIELQTGKYAFTTGASIPKPLNNQRVGLNVSENIIPYYLKQLNYTTKFLGKWSLGFYNSKLLPTNKGIDYFFGSLGFQNINNFNYTSDEGNMTGYDLRVNTQKLKPFSNISVTDLITDEACNVVKLHDQSSPLFLQVSYQSPELDRMNHSYILKHVKSIFNDTDKANHLASLLTLDFSIGKLLDSISDAGLFSNSIILFVPDSSSSGSYNYPLKGASPSVWEGSIRSFALVYFPNQSPRVINDNVHISDWLPTILGATNFDFSKGPKFDGYNLIPFIDNESNINRDIIIHSNDMTGNLHIPTSIRMKDFKLVVNQSQSFISSKSEWSTSIFSNLNSSTVDIFKKTNILCDQGYPHPYLKLRAPPCNATQGKCLYNIKWDPCEYHNLAEFMPKTVSYLLDFIKKINIPYKNQIEENKSEDMKSDPKKFENYWSPWDIEQNLSTEPLKESITYKKDEDKSNFTVSKDVIQNNQDIPDIDSFITVTISTTTQAIPPVTNKTINKLTINDVLHSELNDSNINMKNESRFIGNLSNINEKNEMKFALAAGKTELNNGDKSKSELLLETSAKAYDQNDDKSKKFPDDSTQEIDINWNLISQEGNNTQPETFSEFKIHNFSSTNTKSHLEKPAVNSSVKVSSDADSGTSIHEHKLGINENISISKPVNPFRRVIHEVDLKEPNKICKDCNQDLIPDGIPFEGKIELENKKKYLIRGSISNDVLNKPIQDEKLKKQTATHLVGMTLSKPQKSNIKNSEIMLDQNHYNVKKAEISEKLTNIKVIPKNGNYAKNIIEEAEDLGDELDFSTTTVSTTNSSVINDIIHTLDNSTKNDEKWISNLFSNITKNATTIEANAMKRTDTLNHNMISTVLAIFLAAIVIVGMAIIGVISVISRKFGENKKQKHRSHKKSKQCKK